LRQQGGELAELTFALAGSPVDYIIRGLKYVARTLGIERDVVRSSELAIDPAIRAQSRIIEVVRRIGGDEYVNPPGGRNLYHADAFTAAKIELQFLPEYQGNYASVLERLAAGPSAEILDEINQNLDLQPA